MPSEAFMRPNDSKDGSPVDVHFAPLRNLVQEHRLIEDDEALVHINDAYIYTGLKRASINSRLSQKSKYHDPNFPQPARTPGSKKYFYRRDLVQYVRSKSGGNSSGGSQ